MSLGNLESKEFQRNAREETYGDPSLCIRHHKTFFSWHHVGACYCWHAHLQIYPWWLQVSRDSQKLCSFHSQISLLPRARRCLKPGMKMLTSGRCTSPCQTKKRPWFALRLFKEVLLKDYGKTTEAKRQCFGWSLTVPGGSVNLDGFRRLYNKTDWCIDWISTAVLCVSRS